jgi:DNA replication protein DnaC
MTADRGGPFTRIGDVVPSIESRPAPCPSCGGNSLELRYTPREPLGESLRNRLEPERPFIAKLCAKCLAERDAAEERKKHERKCAAALAALDVPALYAGASLDTFEIEGEHRDRLALALAFARNYVATWPDVPVISVFAGGCGTGKGHLAWSIAKELATAYGASARVTVLSDTIRDLREAWNSGGEGPTEAQRLGKYRGAELLVIDEVSRHAFFGQPQQHLYDLVAWREIRLKPTILTTNEVGEDLSAVLGPALSSRAAGSDGFVHFGTSDWRVAHRSRRIG